MIRSTQSFFWFGSGRSGAIACVYTVPNIYGVEFRTVIGTLFENHPPHVESVMSVCFTI